MEETAIGKKIGEEEIQKPEEKVRLDLCRQQWRSYVVTAGSAARCVGDPSPSPMEPFWAAMALTASRGEAHLYGLFKHFVPLHRLG